MILTKPIACSLAIFLLFLAAGSVTNAADKLETHAAWVREAPPGASVMAAYFTLQNHSSESYTLVGLSSPDFKKVEMHRTEEHQGMSRMVGVEKIIIPAHGSVSFQPGGLHLMLITPRKRPKAGDTIMLTLLFADRPSQQISLPVKKAETSSRRDSASHSHQH